MAMKKTTRKKSKAKKATARGKPAEKPLQLTRTQHRQLMEELGVTVLVPGGGFQAPPMGDIDNAFRDHPMEVREIISVIHQAIEIAGDAITPPELKEMGIRGVLGFLVDLALTEKKTAAELLKRTMPSRVFTETRDLTLEQLLVAQGWVLPPAVAAKVSTGGGHGENGQARVADALPLDAGGEDGGAAAS